LTRAPYNTEQQLYAPCILVQVKSSTCKDTMSSSTRGCTRPSQAQACHQVHQAIAIQGACASSCCAQHPLLLHMPAAITRTTITVQRKLLSRHCRPLAPAAVLMVNLVHTPFCPYTTRPRDCASCTAQPSHTHLQRPSLYREPPAACGQANTTTTSMASAAHSSAQPHAQALKGVPSTHQ
jgi:hypothetical protein